jgi:hypothetical protein
MPRTPQPPSLKSKSHKYGDKDLKTVACRLKIVTRKITKVMIQMMETRSSTRKTPFFGLISPEKMINRIFNPNSPQNDLSSLEYSQKTTLELRNSNFPHPAGYLTLRQQWEKIVLSICILPRTAKIPKQSETLPPPLHKNPPLPTSPPRSPQPASISWPANWRWRPRKQRSRGRRKRRSLRPRSGHTVSAPSTILRT